MSQLQMKETRRLLVPLDLAVDAVVELKHPHAGLRQVGWLVRADILSGRDGGEPGLLLVLRESGDGGPAPLREYRYELPTVAAAVLNYCMKCRIPVPRSARKRIEATAAGFVLSMESDISVTRRHDALPACGAAAAAADPFVELAAAG